MCHDQERPGPADVAGWTHRPTPRRQRRVAQWTRDYAPLARHPRRILGADGEPRPRLDRAFCDALRRLSHRRDRAPLRRRRPAYPRDRHLLPRPGRDGRALLAAEPPAAADRRSRVAADRRRRRRSARNCSNACCATSMARAGWSRTARSRPPRSPAAPNFCARSAASSRPAGASSGSTPPISAAAPTGAGGCSATAPRRRRARATRWRTASCCRAPSASLYKR